MKRKVKRINLYGERYYKTEAENRRIDELRKAALGDTELQQRALAAKSEWEAEQAELVNVMNALKAAREAAGISIRDLEERTGIARSSLSRLENGHGNPTVSTLQRIAKAIGCKVTISLQSLT